MVAEESRRNWAGHRAVVFQQVSFAMINQVKFAVRGSK